MYDPDGGGWGVEVGAGVGATVGWDDPVGEDVGATVGVDVDDMVVNVVLARCLGSVIQRIAIVCLPAAWAGTVTVVVKEPALDVQSAGIPLLESSQMIWSL